jgi:DNA polymerase V
VKQAIYALVDCNNFFVSCERIFRPDLEGRPVVVLSSNDGCAVARSNEAKALGIPMGAPAFKYRQLFKDKEVVQFSANFELYGDVSKRITRILTELTPRTEIYSIDEAFLELSQLAATDYQRVGTQLRDRIWKEVGVPVSVGIAPSKTLAKLASDYAKSHLAAQGVVNITADKKLRATILSSADIEHVWGVGRRLAPRLRGEGLATAADLAQLRPPHARQLMGIHGEQMVRELNGEACLGLQVLDAKPKSIARTRTFGEDTNEFHIIEAALASFATQAAYRLRASRQLTRRAGLFAMTNRHKPGFKSWSREIVFNTPTADTGILIQSLVKVMADIFEPRQQYHRAGVWLHDFMPDNYLQADLLGKVDTAGHDRSTARMQSVDELNTRYGRGMLRFAAEDLADKWQPIRKLRSPRYTTEWDELPTARFT